jgi:hypothetical protein
MRCTRGGGENGHHQKRHRPAEPREAEEDYWFGGASIANEELWIDQSEDHFLLLSYMCTQMDRYDMQERMGREHMGGAPGRHTEQAKQHEAAVDRWGNRSGSTRHSTALERAIRSGRVEPMDLVAGLTVLDLDYWKGDVDWHTGSQATIDIWRRTNSQATIDIWRRR